jgi:hypothetical protein
VGITRHGTPVGGGHGPGRALGGGRLLLLKHEAELKATATEQREKEAARLAHLRRPASPPDQHSALETPQWSPWPESPTCSVVSSRNSASPPVIIDADD